MEGLTDVLKDDLESWSRLDSTKVRSAILGFDHNQPPNILGLPIYLV